MAACSFFFQSIALLPSPVQKAAYNAAGLMLCLQ